MKRKLNKSVLTGRSLFVLLFTAVLTLSACEVKKNESGGGEDPAVKPEQAGGSPSAQPFPRTFLATFTLFNAGTLETISSSVYAGEYDIYDFGCVESADGRDFTFIMKSTGYYPSDMKIHIKNIFVRESKTAYRGLTEVKFDGYSRNRYYEFDSNANKTQVFNCEAGIERVKNFAKGYLQCQYVHPTKRINSSYPNRLHAEMVFQCDIVQR